jgi:hypothetical protein
MIFFKGMYLIILNRNASEQEKLMCHTVLSPLPSIQIPNYIPHANED